MSANETATMAQYLTFTLGDEVFAIQISKVREVLEFTTITEVPRTPDFMRGVINLRGSVVPVIDLRLKFGQSRTEQSITTCIMIAEVSMDDETVIIGALADSVQEVFEIEPGQIEPPPRIGMTMDTDFIKGMGKRDDEFIMILDIDRIFFQGELSMMRQPDLNPHQEEAEADTSGEESTR